ncbi:MAG: hypothetical protein NC218_01185 [Acetobacter sp.]|nr:hypothetical protein [Acetobacter sp.]
MKTLNNIYRLVLILIILAIFGTPLFLTLSREYEEWKIVHNCLKNGHTEEYCKKSLEELLPS